MRAQRPLGASNEPPLLDQIVDARHFALLKALDCTNRDERKLWRALAQACRALADYYGRTLQPERLNEQLLEGAPRPRSIR